MNAILRVLLCVWLALQPEQAVSQEYDHLFTPFTPSHYSQNELRFLQLGLALEGHYNGLLDGAWGRISNTAITRYARDTFDEAPLEIHAALIAYLAADFLERDGWEIRYYDSLGLSFLIPTQALIEAQSTPNLLNYEHSKSSLNYSIGFGDLRKAEALHEYAYRFHAGPNPIYTVRKQGMAITSATNASGQTLYVRSLFWQGQWSTLMISAERQDAALLAAVAASIATEKYAQLYVPRGGYLFSIAATAADLLDAAEWDGQETAVATPPRSSEEASDGSSSGTGFIVSDAGHVLTNAHVVEGCNSLEVNGMPAELITVSTSFDLALVQSSDSLGTQIAPFSPSTARLNQDVIVVGYPLAGLLGGVNVTRGAVSSVTGLGGEETTMQISAPVQPGNSGGPVLSDTGAVLGVVVSKLDAMVVADAIGDIPQNINFAIRGEAARLFLSLNSVTPVMSDIISPLSPIELAEQATKFTVFITCD